MTFTWIAHCLMQINSCVNPFIYAAMLPEFKKLVRDSLSTNRSRRKRSNKSTKPYTGRQNQLTANRGKRDVTEMVEVVSASR